jgi:hypothetical protein
VAIERIIWRDEELAPMMIEGREDFTPRYDIVDRDMNFVARGAKLGLINAVTQEGTRHNAENMNKLLQKCDAQGSFFYRPMGQVPLHNFAHAVQASSWTALPPCPVDMGENPVCIMHGGKCIVTLGHMDEYNGLTYNIAVFDPAVMAWDVKLHEGRKPLNLGGIEDFGVHGGRLFVTGKDWDNVNSATAWLDNLNLDDLSWRLGETVTWPAGVRTLGPIVLAEEGTRPIVFARDGIAPFGTMVDRFTAESKEPTPVGLLPMVNGLHPPVPSGAVNFADAHIITMPVRMLFRTQNFMAWQPAGAHPEMSGGHLLPVGADENHAVFTATQQRGNTFFRMDRDFNITGHEMPRALNSRAVVRGGSRYFHMLSASAQGWAPSRQWGVFDAATGQSAALPDAPEVLTDYGLAAAQDMVFAAKGDRAYLAQFGAVTQGVVLGTVFKGMSVSATRDVFLANDRRTIVAGAGAWHKADDDYLICAAPEAAVFGQIVNYNDISNGGD